MYPINKGRFFSRHTHCCVYFFFNSGSKDHIVFDHHVSSVSLNVEHIPILCVCVCVCVYVVFLDIVASEEPRPIVL